VRKRCRHQLHHSVQLQSYQVRHQFVAGFKNIAISNCVLQKATESPLLKWSDKEGPFANDKKEHYIEDPITGISGIALEVVDGGIMDQVSISNITMTGVQTPIFIRLGSRHNPTEASRT